MTEREPLETMLENHGVQLSRTRNPWDAHLRLSRT